MCAGRDRFGDLVEMQAHRFSIDVRKDQPGCDAASGAGGAEDVAPFVACIVRRTRAGSATRPDAGECSLLAAPCVHRAFAAPPGPGSLFTLETISPGAFPLPCTAGCPLRYCGRFFDRGLRRRVGVGVFRARRQPAKAQLGQIGADHALCQFNAELRLNPTRRSARHQRTTPSRSGSGPASTQLESWPI